MYEFSLKAVDIAGNESGFSNVLTMKTDTVWSRLLDIEEADMGIGYLFYYGDNMDLSGFLFGTMMSGYMEWTVDLPKDTTYRFITHYTTEESFTYPMQIDVNGVKKAEYELKRLPDMTWWGYEDDPGFVISKLDAGKSRIRLTSYAKYTPNMDHVKIMISAPYVPVTTVLLDTTEVRMQVDETFKLNATVYPFDATDKRIVWTSSRNTTAKVDVNGVVKAIALGTATIKAATVDGNYSASCVVTVGATGIEDLKWDDDDVTIYPNPVQNEFFVNISDFGGEKNVDLRLYNSLSNLVKSVKVQNTGSEHIYKFDASGLPNGVYFLQIIGEKKTGGKKILISK